MKKTLFLLSLLAASFIFVACDDDDDTKVSVSDLPENAQLFLQTHFSGIEVRSVEKDNDSYDVYLINGFEVEFDLSGNWDDVDGGTQAVPQSIINLIPENISAYVSANYAQNYISEINKETYGFEIKLNSRLELKFDANGTFLGIDY